MLHLLTDRQLKTIIDGRVNQALRQANAQYEKDLLLKQANITSLQSQIAPHFLYNSLESLRGQALADGSEETAETLYALSQFFHYSINNKGEIATLSDELANAQNYVTIQQFRFRGKFTYSLKYDAEDTDLLSACLPKLSLQPILENAILHGLRNVTSGGEITLKAVRSQEHLIIHVMDNGGGIESGDLISINEWIQTYYVTQETDSARRKYGIALANINHRTQLLFGEDYGIVVFSQPGFGTCVDLLLPFRLSMADTYMQRGN